MLVTVGVYLAVTVWWSDDTFDDAGDLMNAINDAGIECAEQTVFDTERQGLRSGRCYVFEGTRYEVDVYVFDDSKTRDTWMTNLRSAGWSDDILVGDNWFLTTGHGPTTQAIHDAVGGTIDRGSS